MQRHVCQKYATFNGLLDDPTYVAHWYSNLYLEKETYCPVEDAVYGVSTIAELIKSLNGKRKGPETTYEL